MQFSVSFFKFDVKSTVVMTFFFATISLILIVRCIVLVWISRALPICTRLPLRLSPQGPSLLLCCIQ